MLRVRSSLQPAALSRLAAHQVNGMFPDGHDVQPDDLMPAVLGAMQRLEHCFSRINNRYFFDGEEAVFDHLHGDQYAMWLYLLANELYRQKGDAVVCKKLFLLNKALHGIDAFYEVELPSVFVFVHPLATVLGRAQYQDYLIVYQRVGVGSNHDVYPDLGSFLTLRPGSSVLGTCKVGNNCSIAAGALLLDRDLGDNQIYIGNPKSWAVRTHTQPQGIWRI